MSQMIALPDLSHSRPLDPDFPLAHPQRLSTMSSPSWQWERKPERFSCLFIIVYSPFSKNGLYYMLFDPQ